MFTKVVGALDNLASQISRLCHVIPSLSRRPAAAVDAQDAQPPSAEVSDDVQADAEQQIELSDAANSAYEDHNYLDTNDHRRADNKRAPVAAAVSAIDDTLPKTRNNVVVEHEIVEYDADDGTDVIEEEHDAVEVEMLEEDDDDLEEWTTHKVVNFEEVEPGSSSSRHPADDADDDTQQPSFTNSPSSPPERPAAVKTERSTSSGFKFKFESCGESLPFCYTSGGKLGSTMLYTTEEKQLYRRKKEPPGSRSGKERYICRKQSCKATLYLHEERLYKLPGSHGHNHGTQEVQAEQFRFQTEVRKLCRETGADPKSAVEEVLKSGAYNERNLIGLERMRRHCMRLKRANEMSQMPTKKEQRQMCMRCEREPLQVIMSPCMHATICEECRWAQLPETCARCGDPVESVISIMA